MDYSEEQRLFNLCANEQLSGGLAGLENFILKFKGTNEEENYLLKLRKILNLRNGHGTTRIIFLTSYESLQEIINETAFLSHHLLEEIGRDYLKAGLEEYF